MLTIAAARLWATLFVCGQLCSNEAVSVYRYLGARAAAERHGAEYAAFLIRRGDRLRAVAWQSGDGDRASYSGRVPDGCVAIAHTHAPSAPMPSLQDLHEAMRLEVPIIVITPQKVTVATPAGSREVLLASGWQKERGH